MSDTPDVSATPNLQAEAPQEIISLRGLFGRFLALAGLAYGVGFTVILTHTSRLNAPVIEAFQAQTIIAGMPIWLLMCVGVWLSPDFMRRIMGDRNTLSGSVKEALITTAISLGVLIPCGFWVAAKGTARPVPLGIALFVSSGMAFALTITFAVQARSMQWKDPGVRPLFNLLCFWFGFVFFVIGYALLVYPRIPQSLGGGRPVHVQLLLKDREVANLLGRPSSTADSGSETEPLLLYYRTSSYLLVGRSENQPLIQLPVDQVRSIVWLESQSR